MSEEEWKRWEVEWGGVEGVRVGVVRSGGGGRWSGDELEENGRWSGEEWRRIGSGVGSSGGKWKGEWGGRWKGEC